MTSTTRSA